MSKFAKIRKDKLITMIEGMQVRLDNASKVVCLRMRALRRRMINGAWWYIEDDELAAMQAMFNEPHFVEMELECNRCKGTGIYLSYGECWKCTHGRMLHRPGMMTIIDQKGEDGRHRNNRAKEDRRQAIEGQTPIIRRETRCVCGEKYMPGEKCTYSRCPDMGKTIEPECNHVACGDQCSMCEVKGELEALEV